MRGEWCKIPCALRDDPRLAAIALDEVDALMLFGALATLWSYCSEGETDGVVPEVSASRLVGRETLVRLLEARLLLRCEGAPREIVVDGFLAINATRERRQANREKARDRMRLYRSGSPERSREQETNERENFARGSGCQELGGKRRLSREGREASKSSVPVALGRETHAEKRTAEDKDTPVLDRERRGDETRVRGPRVAPSAALAAPTRTDTRSSRVASSARSQPETGRHAARAVARVSFPPMPERRSGALNASCGGGSRNASLRAVHPDDERVLTLERYGVDGSLALVTEHRPTLHRIATAAEEARERGIDRREWRRWIAAAVRRGTREQARERQRAESGR